MPESIYCLVFYEDTVRACPALFYEEDVREIPFLSDGRSYLHLRAFQLLSLPVIPGQAPPRHVTAVLVGTIEEGEPAVVKPPACLPLCGTGGFTSAVVVSVYSGELAVVVFVQGVFGGA